MTQIVTDCFFPAVQIWAQQLYEGLGSNLTLPRAEEESESPPKAHEQLFLLSLICLKTPGRRSSQDAKKGKSEVKSPCTDPNMFYTCFEF